ncbi:TPA: hypothetical protein DDW69_02355 [candidate division CPR2 bacterium]|uniref:Uncharacterized protein n=1 Tax=candidate division CPR2 bacterium GW2011_GWC1_41_48 TaxID=1618344 RepID=A0A0G0Z9Z3_UNCC2|nr:MAG: hypothetical protein UT47_C0001G0273 [candidate division CPR2 bacterium GW2011_GWC2_39_35]KKR28873.1 MAG: hypothetical protein UT59_C0017G0007 [candidate division CPR2 bacterium GW2011_GWD1_39_7]KKR29154.1 MAG: hypothetical protein UT60_C0006G0017 [candidate division CPR2 bacterium GW2011_GWD2_39_7]KKS09868.1 MAG: hypothetical protein UU65_C0001G0273 [candidate division CPR2 bacterium GW2011_GWC1_41_48]OGB61501.1 MAG: hypothetical protein A2Y27_02505 [candidate division CPR2 bacterium G
MQKEKNVSKRIAEDIEIKEGLEKKPHEEWTTEEAGHVGGQTVKGIIEEGEQMEEGQCGMAEEKE